MPETGGNQGEGFQNGWRGSGVGTENETKKWGNKRKLVMRKSWEISGWKVSRGFAGYAGPHCQGKVWRISPALPFKPQQLTAPSEVSSHIL